MESYILPIALVGFLSYKFFKYRSVKKKLPFLFTAGAVVVDVRSKAEFSQASRPGSINIPLDTLNSKVKELDKNIPVILCCASGTRSGIAVGILKAHGFKEVINAGPWSNTIV